MVLQRLRLLGILSDGAAEAAIVGNSYIFEVCFMYCFVKHMYIWSPVMGSSIVGCGSVIV